MTGDSGRPPKWAAISSSAVACVGAVGARVVGPISVVSDSVIGANEVVAGDVPAGLTAIGVPARWGNFDSTNSASEDHT